MNVRQIFYPLLLLVLSACSFSVGQDQQTVNPDDVLKESLSQLDLLIQSAYQADKIPRTVDESGNIYYTKSGFDWTEGFFPGLIWYAYSIEKDEKYRTAADYFQNKFVDHRLLTTNHDLGFVFNNSFGLAYRLTNNEDYQQVLVDAGNSLIQRYDSTVGCIKTWDCDKGWQAQRGWKFPVIIDNMMNLEMLFELTEMTGDSKYREIAISHANTTMKNHFRDDFSSYHVVDYDPETGEVRSRQTAQGYAHESAWARGQAWGLYGFTMCYRYTRDPQYLELAEKIAQFILNNPQLPEDKVPYWDFDSPKIPNEPRDASAAAVITSALIELDGYAETDYLTSAKEILESLSGDVYYAKLGKNNNFILMHSVGSIPHGAEIDVPLNYADYYFVEALLRLKNIGGTEPRM